MDDFSIRKYPRTPHIEGSRLQPGDEDLSQIRMSELIGKHLVIEEKIDGANTAISFDNSGNMLLQTRGHYMTGGYKERHYNLMKIWANVHRDSFYKVLGSRYIMYGEWMYAKHKVFYDALPAYFMEFDIYDRVLGIYLDTHKREELTKDLPISHVPVLGEGFYKDVKEITSYIKDSKYITSNHIEVLKKVCNELNLNTEDILSQTDPSCLMEGVYVKWEEDGVVKGRYKYVRASFNQSTIESDIDWFDRVIIPNQLCVDVNSLYENKK